MLDQILYPFHSQVIANYLQPEPFWVRGSWDTAACDAQCSGNATNAAITQVADVTCSRGFWLLCSGRDSTDVTTAPTVQQMLRKQAIQCNSCDFESSCPVRPKVQDPGRAPQSLAGNALQRMSASPSWMF